MDYEGKCFLEYYFQIYIYIFNKYETRKVKLIKK